MNKYKKIAMGIVSVVMAGAMMLSFAACKPSSSGGDSVDTPPDNPPPSVDDPSYEAKDYWSEEPTLADNLKPNLDANGKLTYASGTELRLNVGNSATQTTAYTSDELTGDWKFPDGNTYTSGSAKPAWAAMASQLGLKFTDAYVKADRIGTSVTNKTLGNYDVITGSLSDAVTYADSYLNLNDYVYYMPNYKAFLMNNQVTLWSLTADATNGAMYAAPYFDGNDDIEYYDLVRKDWVRTILDSEDYSAATTTFAEQAAAKGLDGTKATYESYMPGVAQVFINCTDPDDVTKLKKVDIKWNTVKTEATTEGTELYNAISEATGGKVYSGEKTTIVDLQNFVINETKGNVTGAQLIKILRAYIDVCYTTTVGGNWQTGEAGTTVKAYETRSDVFNGYDAAWDADLLVGLMRCIVTSQNLFEDEIKNLNTGYLYGIMARQNTTQRRVGLLGLAGELFGVRGMESRYEYTYIDKDGNLQDARQNPDTYEALNYMSGMAKEGLLYTGNLGTDGMNSYVNSKSVTATDGAVAFMTHDYVQTQTRYSIDGSTSKAALPDGYEFAPIVTPIAYWDDGSEAGLHPMRFVESWRSTKNTGFSIPLTNVQGNPDKLSAVLAFVDYLFSSDGQLLMTYGTASTSGTNPDGWWYCPESSLSLSTVAEESVAATNYAPAQYTVKDEYKQKVFVFNGKVYEGLAYADRNVPIMTDASRSWFLGQDWNGTHPGQEGLFSGVSSVVGNYTNYARQVLGTTLPIGNKDQGFEYQCTADAALAGAAIVAAGLNNGTISHVKITPADFANGEGWWYLIAPTSLPLSSAERKTMTDSDQLLISGTYFYNSSSTDQITNVFLDIIFYGLGDTTHNICGKTELGSLKASGQAYVDWLGDPLVKRIQIYQNNWIALDNHYEITGLGS